MVTGDEPHYLVMSSGIIDYGSLEQTAPYLKEFKSWKIYKHGLAPKDAQPAPENTHAVLGPRGLFNVHNIGLPILLALPFMLGGIIGAKLFMIFCGALVAVAAWKFSSYFSKNEVYKFWGVTGATISLPLLPASNQIYPDILAGLIAIAGLYWFLTTPQRRTKSLEFFLATAIVFLPWLQIKFAATCLLLVIAISAKIYIDSKDLQRVFRLLIIAGASFTALAFYNYYAFGKVSGPYESGALEISKQSLMVLIGLHLDQNHGFLITNPLNFIGVLAIGWLYRFNRTFTVIWGLVFLSLIVPNALHPNWYGGGSFSGRFGVSAAVVFLIPVIYGLLEIGRKRKRIFQTIIAGGIFLQLYFFYQYTIVGVDLYNRGAKTWFDSYSIFYFPIHSWMPMLYNASWAYGYAPNYAWIILFSCLLLVGFLSQKKLYVKMSALAIFLVVLVFASGLLKHEQFDEISFTATQLPSQTGRLVDLSRLAEQNLDDPGFINYGPYYRTPKGNYVVTLTYSSSGEASNTIGSFDIFNAASGLQILKIPIYGTNNAIKELNIKFATTERSSLLEFRTFWNGSSNINMKNIILKNY